MSQTYLGGMTILGVGWLGPQAVYVDFVTQFNQGGWLFQLYANRTLIGVTQDVDQNRIVGQLIASGTPCVLTLLRVDQADVMTDFGASLPNGPFNRFALQWTQAGGSADLDHWDITIGGSPGASPDPSLLIASVPYVGDQAYSFVLPAVDLPGTWKYGLTPRDNAKPLGNAGAIVVTSVNAAVPPPDVQWVNDGRLTCAVAGGVLTVGFEW